MNQQFCIFVLVFLLIFLCLFLQNYVQQIESEMFNLEKNSVCDSNSIYCALNKTCLKNSCVYQILNELDECPLETVYCPDTDECLYRCPKTQNVILPVMNHFLFIF